VGGIIKKILVVEDNLEVVQVIYTCLHIEGYEVFTAVNGREALDIVAAQPFDLILMDVMMPEMDGLDAVRKLKEDKATADIPVIMLTARGEAGDIMKSLQAGAELHLTKPFDCDELLTVIDRLGFV
jgi:CheY-like chemotaxis protein